MKFNLSKIFGSPTPKKEIEIIEVNWPLVKETFSGKTKGIVFREINHHKRGKSIFVYPAGTTGGGHMGIVAEFKPEKFFDSITIIDVKKKGSKLILIYE